MNWNKGVEDSNYIISPKSSKIDKSKMSSNFEDQHRKIYKKDKKEDVVWKMQDSEYLVKPSRVIEHSSYLVKPKHSSGDNLSNYRGDNNTNKKVSNQEKGFERSKSPRNKPSSQTKKSRKDTDSTPYGFSQTKSLVNKSHKNTSKLSNNSKNDDNTRNFERTRSDINTRKKHSKSPSTY